MAENPLDRSFGSPPPPLKAGLTKPERLSARRSLPPPPPSAVQAAKKSLPPPPAPAAPAGVADVDVDMEEDDDATIVRDRSDFAGFFDADDDGNASKPEPALGSSPWALPPVQPKPSVIAADPARPKLETLADSAVLDEPSNPLVALTPSDQAATRDLTGPAFGGVTEGDRTEEIHEVEDADEVTVAANERPERDEFEGADAKDGDLDALFGTAKATPAHPSLGKPPPPAPGPPSLKPPPPPPSPSRPPVLAEPPPARPSAVLPTPDSPRLESPLLEPPRLGAPLPPLASSGLAGSGLAGSGFASSGLPPLPPSAASGLLPPLPPSAPPPLPFAGSAVPPPFPSSSSAVPPPPPFPSSSSAVLPPPAPPSLQFQDDEPTQVFDRGSLDSAPPPRFPGAPPLPSGLPPLPGAGPLPSFAPSSIPPAPALSYSDAPRDYGTAKLYERRSVQVAGALLVAAAVALFFLWPSTGRLVVAVSGPNGTVVDGIKVSLDDKVVCTSSPCELADVEPKSYLVTVEAEGFERTAPQAVIVEGGKDAVANVMLQSPIVTAPTGVDIPASGPGLTLFVDGKEIGELPQRVVDLTPGEHRLRVVGGDRYSEAEKTINVVEGQMLSLQPFELDVKLGRATINEGDNAEGAKVLLNGKVIQLPHSVDLDTSKTHTLTASKDGFENFEQKLTFEAGQAEATFTVALEGGEDDAAEAEAEASDGDAVKTASATKRSSSRSKKSSSATGTLNITSVPSAMVILDGRPIGKTPKHGVKVSPGAHSIVFVSDKGRKRATTKVPAGGTKTVSVRF